MRNKPKKTKDYRSLYMTPACNAKIDEHYYKWEREGTQAYLHPQASCMCGATNFEDQSAKLTTYNDRLVEEMTCRSY